jgi:hypothetical protein
MLNLAEIEVKTMDIFDLIGKIKCKLIGHDIGYAYKNKCPSCAMNIEQIFSR